MKRKIRIILSVLIFAISVYAAFIFEDEYRKSVRWFYELLSENKISFRHPYKYLHFASGIFVSFIGVFFIGVLNSLFDQKRRQVIINLLLSLMLFSASLVMYSAIDVRLKIAECTMCDDGLRILNYNDIDYDRIMIVALLFAVIPWMISQVKIHKNKR